MCGCVVSVVIWCIWSVCEIVFVPYLDAVVAVTVMHMRMLKECEGARVTAMLVWGMEVWLW